MTDFYDALELRDPAERERDLLAALPKQVLQAQSATAAFAQILDGVKPSEVDSSRWIASMVPVILGSVAGRNPTSGIMSALASRLVEP